MKRWMSIIIIMLSSIVTCPVIADELQWAVTKQIHPHMIPFTFQLWHSDDNQTYLSILTPEGHEIQRLPNITSEKNSDSLCFVDLNFDGVLDFYLHLDKEKDNYQYFIYDKEKAAFFENKTLSGLNKPVFIQKEKMIVSEWKEKNIKTSDYYQFIDNELTLRKQEVIECDKFNRCEKILLINQDGILVEKNREFFEDENKKTLEHYLSHLIDRKGLCLAHTHENSLQGNRLQGVKETSLCLNTLAYELIPMIDAKIPMKNASMTLQLRDVISQHFNLVKLLTVCEDVHNNCEDYQEEIALLESIKLVDRIIQRMASLLAAEHLPLENINWIAKWEGLNEIMQG